MIQTGSFRKPQCEGAILLRECRAEKRNIDVSSYHFTTIRSIDFVGNILRDRIALAGQYCCGISVDFIAFSLVFCSACALR
jgi:hypothetical protein